MPNGAIPAQAGGSEFGHATVARMIEISFELLIAPAHIFGAPERQGPCRRNALAAEPRSVSRTAIG